MADDLTALAFDLTEAAVRAGVDGRKAVEVELYQAKQEWQAAWSDITGMPHIGRSVTYDTRVTASGFEGEVGPDPDRVQGPLDNIVEYGSSQHGPIRPVTEQIARQMGERLERYLAAATKDLLT